LDIDIFKKIISIFLIVPQLF